MDDISDIRTYYDGGALTEDQRLVEHQLEFDITWRWLMQALPERGHILELGAATGRYTLPLAERGFTVTAFDLSVEVTQLARAKGAAGGTGISHRVCGGRCPRLDLPGQHAI